MIARAANGNRKELAGPATNSKEPGITGDCGGLSVRQAAQGYLSGVTSQVELMRAKVQALILDGVQQLNILHQIAAETPLYPGFVRISDYHKTSHVTVMRCYSVRANDGDIRRFDSQLFALKGWTLAEEQKLGEFHPEGSYRL